MLHWLEAVKINYLNFSSIHYFELPVSEKEQVAIYVNFLIIYRYLKLFPLLSCNLDQAGVCYDLISLKYFDFKELSCCFFSLMLSLEKYQSLFLFFIFLPHFWYYHNSLFIIFVQVQEYCFYLFSLSIILPFLIFLQQNQLTKNIFLQLIPQGFYQLSYQLSMKMFKLLFIYYHLPFFLFLI